MPRRKGKSRNEFCFVGGADAFGLSCFLVVNANYRKGRAGQGKVSELSDVAGWYEAGCGNGQSLNTATEL